jgi:hypothetical protein
MVHFVKGVAQQQQSSKTVHRCTDKRHEQVDHMVHMLAQLNVKTQNCMNNGSVKAGRDTRLQPLL